MLVALTKITIPRNKKEIKKEEQKVEILGYQEVDEKEFWNPILESLCKEYFRYRSQKGVYEIDSKESTQC